MTTFLACLALYVLLCGVSTAALLALNKDLRDDLFNDKDGTMATICIFLMTPLVAIAFIVEWACSGLDGDYRS